MRSIRLTLLLMVVVPLALVALAGTIVAWTTIGGAVRERNRLDALGLVDFVASSFEAVEDVAPGTEPRVAHRAVTAAVRSSWTGLSALTGLRIIGPDGVVRWSRQLSEEDRPSPEAARLLAARGRQEAFPSGPGWPWSESRGGEVVMMLGGASCQACHPGQRAAGVVQLSVGGARLEGEVQGVFRDALWFVLGLCAAAALAVVVAVRLVVTRRLARLAQVMRQAQHGNHLVRAPPLGDDELGALAQGFNSMLRALTELEASEIDKDRDLAGAKEELRLKGELEQVVSELRIIYDLARAITSTLELNEVLERICAVVPPRLQVEKFSIMLLNSEGLLEVLKAFPPNVGSEGLTFAIGEGVCGVAARTLTSVYVPDLTVDTTFKVRGDPAAKGQGCLVSIPMVHRGELMGVLNFERLEKASFAPQEIEFLTGVTDQAATAVQNARLHERTVAMSVTDPLTGIPNRRHLFQQLDAELNRARRFGTPLSVLMVDIDHFKKLNDTHGHRVGDEVLRQVCGVLRRNVRKVDTLARYGGEEFVVLLPQVGAGHGAEVAEKLRGAVERLTVPELDGPVTISVGVSCVPEHGVDQATLVDRADAALYASKREGRNRVTVYRPGMDLDPGRERGPSARRRRTGEFPASLR